MNRRQFFGAVAGATAVSKLPATPRAELDMAHDAGVGINIIRHGYDPISGTSRVDALYGWGKDVSLEEFKRIWPPACKTEYSVRILS